MNVMKIFEGSLYIVAMCAIIKTSYKYYISNCIDIKETLKRIVAIILVYSADLFVMRLIWKIRIIQTMLTMIKERPLTEAVTFLYPAFLLVMIYFIGKVLFNFIPSMVMKLVGLEKEIYVIGKGTWPEEELKKDQQKRVNNLLNIEEYKEICLKDSELTLEPQEAEDIQNIIDKINEAIGNVEMTLEQKKTWYSLTYFGEKSIENICDVIKKLK